MYDLAILGGRICDGSGKEPFRGDVGIVGRKIAKIGLIDPAMAKHTLDAEGTYVAPGFIDLHSHADTAILGDPRIPAKLLQGVTTEAVGNCGLSPAPVSDATVESLKKYVAPTLGIPQYPWTWRTFAQYLSTVESRRPSCNVIAFVGHGALRILATGFSPCAPTSKQMDTMVSALEESFAAGAVGLSLGLIYAPSCYADVNELEELCRVVARYDRLLAVHVRNESDRLLESVGEMISLASRTGARLHISHLKASGAANFGKPAQVLEMIDRARAQGMQITCDQYPYVAGSTTISVLLPQWVLEGGVAAMVSRLKDQSIRDRIKREYESGIDGWDCLVKANGWDNIVLSWIERDSFKHLEGMTLADIAAASSKEPAEALFDLVEDTAGNASIIVFQQSEEDVKQTMRCVRVKNSGAVFPLI